MKIFTRTSASKMFLVFLMLHACLVLSAKSSASFRLRADKAITISSTCADRQVVHTAMSILKNDLRDVFSSDVAITSGTDADIIASTLTAGMPDNYRGVDVSPLKGRRQAFVVAVDDEGKLVVVGSDQYGTAYGLMEVSRLIGVSPWVWWADSHSEKKKSFSLASDFYTFQYPSVEYRGIFINDEDWGFQPWAAKNMDPDRNNVGPNSYAKVMELLLRLRANTLWPAMHLCSEAFWANKANLPVAKKYDIVLGSSHCEQMLRDNEWEWRRWGDGTGTYENWNYVTNKEKIQQYWEERVIESKGFDAIYTTGMRGVHDWAISGYPTTEDKVRGLTEIIGFQRELLQRHIGDPTTVPQIFIPYKEVLEAYNAGLQVPEDITLTWVDDNHGYIRQMPTKSEQARSGGNGIYYHLSYWGTPQDYLWLCSTSPSLISYELSKGYEYGIRNLWIINVGDIKPAEAELEFCMELEWDVDRWNPEEAHKFSRYWAAKTFGEEYADDLSDIKQEYYRLGAGGKPEHIFAVNYTDEEKAADPKKEDTGLFFFKGNKDDSDYRQK